VRRLESLAIIKDGRVVAAMEISVRFDKKMIGEDAPTISE